MKDEIDVLIKRVCRKWDKLKATEQREKVYEGSEYTIVKTKFGDTMSWDNPNLLWLLQALDGDGEVYADLSKKSFELSKLTNDWEKIVKVNLELLLKK